MPRLLALAFLAFTAFSAFSQTPAPQDVDIAAPDGAKLRATFFAAEKPGPGVLLLHMCNTTRKSWEPVAKQLSQAGINALTIDNRGFGESGGPRFDVGSAETAQMIQQQWPGDFDAAYKYLATQPGVDKERIAVGGGSCGVDNAIKLAERHPDVKAMVLLAGNPNDVKGTNFIFNRSEIPIFTAAAADDQYNPDFAQMMDWYAQLSGNPRSKSVRFADGHHGTEIFGPHPELVTQITAFYVDVLITKRGGPVLDPRRNPVRDFWALASHPGDTVRAAEMFHKLRKKNPKLFLFPEAPMNLLGYARIQSGDNQDAVELFKLNAEAYPTSANAQDSLSDGYLALGQKDLALAADEKCLELLPADKSPADFKAAIKQAAEKKIAELKAEKK